MTLIQEHMLDQPVRDKLNGGVVPTASFHDFGRQTVYSNNVYRTFAISDVSTNRPDIFSLSGNTITVSEAGTYLVDAYFVHDGFSASAGREVTTRLYNITEANTSVYLPILSTEDDRAQSIRGTGLITLSSTTQLVFQGKHNTGSTRYYGYSSGQQFKVLDIQMMKVG